VILRLSLPEVNYVRVVWAEEGAGVDPQPLEAILLEALH